MSHQDLVQELTELTAALKTAKHQDVSRINKRIVVISRRIGNI